ncbi:hypothetical protein D3C72_1994730 [compost metagenome]
MLRQALGNAAWPDQAEHDARLHLGIARLGHGGHVLQNTDPTWRRHRQGPHLACLNHGQGHGDRGEEQVHLATNQIGDGGRRSAVRNVQHVHSRLALP